MWPTEPPTSRRTRSPLEPQLDRVHRLQADHRQRRDDRGALQHTTGAEHHRAGAVHRDQPAVPLLAGHDRRDGVLAHAAGQLVVAGHQQDAVGRGQVGVGQHVGRRDHGLVGADAGHPPGRGELGERVVGRGVEQPQPVADLLDLVRVGRRR